MPMKHTLHGQKNTEMKKKAFLGRQNQMQILEETGVAKASRFLNLHPGVRKD